MDSEVCSKQLRRSWARLIKKIYQVDPLVCQKCQASMRIISFIGQECIIEKILRHLGLWQSHNHDPPIGNASDISEFIIDYDHSQVAPIDYWLQ